MRDWLPAESNLLLLDTTVIFAAGLLFALLMRWLRQSSLLGYLLAGLFIGPHGLGLVLDSRNINFLAEVGVVLLMFALGVQLSLRHLLEVRGMAVIGGLLQVTFGILLGLGIGVVTGLPPIAGLLLGYALALSSSVVVVRLLGDYDEAQTRFGRIALGFSVLQDLVAVVLISTLPFIAPGAPATYPAVLFGLGKGVLFVIWVIVLARWVAPRVLAWASATGSREVFLPTVLVLSLIGAIFSSAFGFSYALGAFLAGLVISESLYSQAVLAEVLPLRDLFGLLFFVSLGMLVNPGVLVGAGGLVLLLLLAAVLIKPLSIFGILLAFRQHPYVALVTAILLGQIGEFSFIIAREAQQAGVISAGINTIILSVAILSIALTPMLVPASRWAYRRLRHREYHQDEILPPSVEIHGVLLCGYGRVGRSIAQALDTFRVPLLVVDIDRRAVQSLQRRGIRAVYGDAANPRLLERIHAERFALAVIAVTEQQSVLSIATHLRRMCPRMRLILRSHSDRETALYLAMGVEDVVHVEMEASLAFVHEALTTANVDPEIVAAYLEDIRLGYYEGLRPREREE